MAVPPDGDLEATIEGMARDTQTLAHRVMPAVDFFKIGVSFDMVEKKGAVHRYSPDGFSDAPIRDWNRDWNRAVPVTEGDKAATRELQENLPLIFRPFDRMALRPGLPTSELFGLVQEFQGRKILRRCGAVLHHRRSGISANAMIAWQVPLERSDAVGMRMAQHSAVTHCYERPTFPDRPYNHFTMVHATTLAECEVVAREISDATGITENLMLYSTREYRKTRVRYFVEGTE